MRRLKLSRWVAVLALAIALAPSTTSAQEPDTLSISGPFRMDELRGTTGADLAGVFARGGEHWWSLNLRGVTYSYETIYNEPYEFDEQSVTRVHATSFDFRFFGPDEDTLNAVVSQQLLRGSLDDGVFLELRNVSTWGGEYWYSTWNLGLLPLDPNAGVSFVAGHGNLPSLFSWDANYYPAVEPQLLLASQTVIADHRPGASGELASIHDAVDIGSAGPPAPLTLSIGDGSVLEGNRYTSRLVLKVTISSPISDWIWVDYQTVNGTALANKDYYATGGTLTFGPGVTTQTITLWILGERKREANETFSVQLSGAVNATIGDSLGVATILNDD